MPNEAVVKLPALMVLRVLLVGADDDLRALVGGDIGEGGRVDDRPLLLGVGGSALNVIASVGGATDSTVEGSTTSSG